MTIKKRKALLSCIYSVLFLVCISYVLLESLDIYSFLAALIVPSILTYIIGLIIPVKKKKSVANKTKKIPAKFKAGTTAPNSKKHLTDMELLTADIDSLLGTDFERLVYLYFEDKGFKPQTTPKSGDHGVDLVVTDPKDGLKIAVQCKRYKSTNSIGNADLIKLEGGKRFYKCPSTLFITTSSFTNKAKEYAESVGMDTWNGLQVNEKIGKWRKEKLKKIG